MKDTSINIVIGGEAGQGLATVGLLLSKSLVRAGYHIVVTQDYMSRIRGGHNTFAIRTDAEPVHGGRSTVDILVALTQETVSLHKDRFADKGLAILGEKLEPEGLPSLQVPFKELAPKPIFENVAALGVLCAILGIDREVPAGLLTDTFKKKGQEIVDQNLEVLDKALSWAGDNGNGFPSLPKAEARGKRLMLNGNEAITLGALAAGVKFCSFYPMTPSTTIAQGLINHGPKMGVVVEQVEDEIAAANMGLGAAAVGARTLVPTSGGGFALMVEAVSLAGVMEMPIVFALAQRPGPATGLPTRTEQGDLNLVVYAGHGEFPRAAFAPGDLEECFHLTYRAFDQAELSQSPVFILTDQYLADSLRGVAPFDLKGLPDPVTPETGCDDPEGYERYALTDSGVSPRMVPGACEALVVHDSHEHTPDGHITEDPDVRVAMQDKRMRKNNVLWEQIVPPTLDGSGDPDVLLVGWGSTKGPLLEAVQLLRDEGIDASCMHFSQVWPLNPDQFLPVFKRARRIVSIEGNATGQFTRLIRTETGFSIVDTVLRYDGRPITAEFILDRVHKG